MTQTKEMICIACPVGCRLTVSADGGDIRVQGNGCPRGIPYARQEALDPQRMVTSTVALVGDTAPGSPSRLPVRTSKPVSKAQIPIVLDAMTGIRATAPVRVGDVLVANVARSGADIIATRNIDL